MKDGDRYRTTYAGEKVYEALATGTFTERVPDCEGETEHDCPLCSATMSARYADGHLSMTCPTHGDIVLVTLPPQAAAGRDLSELVRLADLEGRQMHRHLADGVCPRCWADLSEVTYTREVPENWTGEAGRDPPDENDRGMLVRFDCTNCGTSVGSSVELLLAMTAEAVAFFADHGVDALDRNLLALPGLVEDGTSRLRRDDGEVVGVTVSVTADGETLTARFDERGRVESTERVPAE